MTKRKKYQKKQNKQTIVNKTLHRKIKIEQHEQH